MHPFGEKARSFPRRFAALFYGSLFLVLFAATLLFFIEETGVKAVALSPAATRTLVRGYFRNGQWRADARTLVAAARWCLEPSSVFPNTPANLPVPPTLATNTPPMSRT